MRSHFRPVRLFHGVGRAAPATGLTDQPAARGLKRIYAVNVPGSVRLSLVSPSGGRDHEIQPTAYEPQTQSAAWDLSASLIQPGYLRRLPDGRQSIVVTVRAPWGQDSHRQEVFFGDFTPQRLSSQIGTLKTVGLPQGTSIYGADVDGRFVDSSEAYGDTVFLDSTRSHVVRVYWGDGGSRSNVFNVEPFNGIGRLDFQPIEVTLVDLPERTKVSLSESPSDPGIQPGYRGTYMIPVHVDRLYFHYPTGQTGVKLMGSLQGKVNVNAGYRANGISPPQTWNRTPVNDTPHTMSESNMQSWGPSAFVPTKKALHMKTAPVLIGKIS